MGGLPRSTGQGENGSPGLPGSLLTAHLSVPEGELGHVGHGGHDGGACSVPASSAFTITVTSAGLGHAPAKVLSAAIDAVSGKGTILKLTTSFCLSAAKG